jgi:hypothetical protein
VNEKVVGEWVKALKMCATVEASVMTEQMLIKHFTEPQAGQTSGKSSSDGSKHRARGDARRTCRQASVHANACAYYSTCCARCSRTTDCAGYCADSAANTLAVIGINNP